MNHYPSYSILGALLPAEGEGLQVCTCMFISARYIGQKVERIKRGYK